MSMAEKNSPPGLMDCGERVETLIFYDILGLLPLHVSGFQHVYLKLLEEKISLIFRRHPHI